MRFMIIVKATKDSEAGVMPEDKLIAETKELVAGYTLIKARSREEAIEWTRRFPNPAHYGKDGEIEVRQLFELEDFEQTDAVQRFRELGLGEQGKTTS